MKLLLVSIYVPTITSLYCLMRKVEQYSENDYRIIRERYFNNWTLAGNHRVDGSGVHIIVDGLTIMAISSAWKMKKLC
uniref:Uncharacterized protein n=1 Tax=Candidatus Kentrum sp. TC TaxID=2126339 RepID=A0A450YS35_9GAMM|nr:MAG: hypothetical protein BECKTC1821D_GA0114238_102025 [Candidatus Kentron sp. TC]